MNNNYMIERINIGGYRSYSTKWGGQDINYKKINLFIGPNNSGKSNIIKFIHTLRKHYNNPNTLLKEEDVHLKEIDNDDTYGTISFQNGSIIAAAKDKLLVMTESSDSIGLDINGFFEKGIFYINADRSDISYNLKGMFSELLNPHEYIKKIEEWLRVILDERIKLEWNDSRSPTELIFNLYPTLQDLTQTVDDLGTGVQQVLKILTFIYSKTEIAKKNKLEGINIFIEEPEANLHAKAVISLVKILSYDDFFKECRFFITTHSNAFIDQANDDWTISRIEINGERNTELIVCIDNSDKFKMLDSLGIKASQLMQSNIVIWIEGPSDRLYIKKWLDLDSNFIEGKHYSFMMYGGSLLAHLSANIEMNNSLEEFVDILSTSNYAIVVIDKDRNSDSTEASLKNRVKEIKSRILAKKVNDRVEILLTNGREIENFVPKKLILNVLQTFNRDRVSYHNSENKKRTINFKNKKYNAPKLKNFRFTKNDNFNVSYANWLLTDQILSDHSINRDDKIYNAIIKNLKKISKVEFAKRVTQEFEIEDMNNGLKEWLEIMKKKIKKANR